jgi:hypothetical protein
MFTPVLKNYGYGWSVWQSSRAGGRVAAHDGHIMPEGFNGYYLRLPERDAAVIVLANRGDLALAERVAWILTDILNGKDSLPLPELGRSAVTPTEGLYRAENGARLLARRIGSRWSLEPLNQAAADLFLEPSPAAAAATERIARALASVETEWPEALAETIAAARQQAERFGAYTGHEAVYSVQEDGFVRTHLRHFAGRDTLYTRVDIVDGRIAGGTDAGAFIAAGRGLTPTLARVGIAPGSNGTWAAYDFWSRRQTMVAVGDGMLRISTPGGSVSLRLLETGAAGRLRTPAGAP